MRVVSEFTGRHHLAHEVGGRFEIEIIHTISLSCLVHMLMSELQVAFTGSTNTGRAVMKSAADIIKVKCNHFSSFVFYLPSVYVQHLFFVNFSSVGGDQCTELSCSDERT